MIGTINCTSCVSDFLKVFFASSEIVFECRIRQAFVLEVVLILDQEINFHYC